MVTILGIVFTDLLTGIGIGLVVAIFYILYNIYKKPFLLEAKKHIKDGIIRLELAEDVTFINKASISGNNVNRKILNPNIVMLNFLFFYTHLDFL